MKKSMYPDILFVIKNLQKEFEAAEDVEELIDNDSGTMVAAYQLRSIKKYKAKIVVED